jgi:hypothetical protein
VIPSMVIDTRSSLLDKHGGHLCNEMGMKHISFGGCPHCIISSSVHVKHLCRNMEVPWNGCTPGYHPLQIGIFHEINEPAIGVPPWLWNPSIYFIHL